MNKISAQIVFAESRALTKVWVSLLKNVAAARPHSSLEATLVTSPIANQWTGLALESRGVREMISRTRYWSIMLLNKEPTITQGVIFAALICLFIYGVVRFPDGPIRPCGNEQFCGKHGKFHSSDEYKSFKEWDTAMGFGWPLGLLSLFLISLRPKKLRPRDIAENAHSDTESSKK